MPVLVLIVLVLAGCAGDRTKIEGNSKFDDVAPMSRDAERKHIIDDAYDFCRRYPDDPVCHPRK